MSSSCRQDNALICAQVQDKVQMCGACFHRCQLEWLCSSPAVSMPTELVHSPNVSSMYHEFSSS